MCGTDVFELNITVSWGIFIKVYNSLGRRFSLRFCGFARYFGSRDSPEYHDTFQNSIGRKRKKVYKSKTPLPVLTSSDNSDTDQDLHDDGNHHI